jgi:hypothetical protein
VERRNRIVVEMTRSLLKSMEVPARFWGEAVRHSVYLLNRLPTKAMGNCTPYEAWNRRKPHLGHLKVFGCNANVRPAKPSLKKLDDRSRKMMYLGVEEGYKAHRLYDAQHNRIVVSRDVVFECVRFEWGAQVNQDNSVEFEVVEDDWPVKMVRGAGDVQGNDAVSGGELNAEAGETEPTIQHGDNSSGSVPDGLQSPSAQGAPIANQSPVRGTIGSQAI